MAYQPGGGTEIRPAPYPATYALYAVTPEGVGSVPLDRASVERHDQVGFVRQPDGTLSAYAGGRKIPLDEGQYVWQVTPETQRARSGTVEAEAEQGSALVAVGTVLEYVGLAAGMVALGLLKGLTGGGASN